MDRARIAFASETDRATIYGIRHTVYAEELAQHTPNSEGYLTDPLDESNEYIVATRGSEVIGFVSITPPGTGSLSVDKYFSRDDLPFPVNSTLYEVRLLTVQAHHRGRSTAALLMYAAFRWIESLGGTRIVAIGREELREFYRKAGLRMHGHQVLAGAVTYDLMSATIPDLKELSVRSAPTLGRLEASVDWDLGIPFLEEEHCFHGGAFFEAVGDTFDTLSRSAEVVNADVLDAWFPPAPGALSAVKEYLPWLLRTSPPTDANGLVRTISSIRGVPIDSVVVGAGSSALIFLAFREWLTSESRVLLLDPTYGEYAHVLERVIGCHVDRILLSRSDGFPDRSC